MTTERILPRVALPIPGRIGETDGPDATVADRGRPAVGARTVRRSEPWLTGPARAGMLIGASAAVYAVTLAGVAGIQSQSDAEIAARREPWLTQVNEMRAANDELEAALVAAGAEAEALGAEYSATGDALAAYQSRLDDLAALVAEVQGTAASLPSRISLPKVSVHGAVRASRPSTSATSGASGG